MKKRTNIKIKKLIPFICFVIIGAFCGIFIGSFLTKQIDAGITAIENLFTFCILIIFMYIGMLLGIVIHEAGHLVFGLISGYKFTSFRVGSFMLLKSNGKFRFCRYSLAGTGGQCLMGPPDMKDGKMPGVLYNFGGALMNLFTAVLFAGLYYGCGSEGIFAIGFMEFAIISLGFAIMNGVPMSLGEIDNDGYNAISFGKNKAAVRAFWIQFKMNQQLANGVDLISMPEEWFEMPTEEAMKNSLIAALGVFSCNRTMYMMNFEKADREMKELLRKKTGMVGVHRSLLVADRIYCELVGENREEVLTKYMDKNMLKFIKIMKNFPSILRTQYAYALLAEKDSEKANQIKAKFRKMQKGYPYPSDLDYEVRLMKYAEEKTT